MTRYLSSFGAFVLAVAALFPAAAFAAPFLSISSPAADGTFVLRGEQLTGVAGLDVSIGYDAATLRNPRVSLGGLVAGMMSSVNPANPVRMAIVGTKPVSGGSGVIATITFDRTGSAPGAITSLNASLIDGNGKKVAMASPFIVNPPVPVEAQTPTGENRDDGSSGDDSEGEAPSDGTAGGDTDAPGTTRPFVLGGSVTLPEEGGDAVERKEAPVEEGQTGAAEHELQREEVPAAPEDESRGEESKPATQPVTQPKQLVSVAERFRLYQGERSPANLKALFQRDPADVFVQIPSIALSDGKATVTLVIAAATGDRAPNFAFNGCRYVALGRSAEGEWEIEARPEPGVVSASVSMLYNGLVQELPLTVVPKVDLVPGRSRPATEADFQRFLQERGTPEAPAYDLNKDGRRDYLDDYIYTANYLLQAGQREPRQVVK